MKNIFRFLMAVAVLFTASCAKEDISSSIGGGEVEVTFSANLPELGTRAYADGANATTLRYYVYEGDNYLRGISSETLGTTALTNGKAVVTLPLLKGMTYNIIFWADNGSDIYTIDPATKVLTVDYTGVMSNDDSRDAFYKYLTNVDPTNATKIKEQAKVTLTRPFGQLNAATSDFEAVENNGVTLTTSSLKVTTFTKLNLETGIATDADVVIFDATAMPCSLTPDKETLKSGYEYLSMNYLLPGTVDAEYTFKGKRNSNDSEVVFTGTTYTNVPVKANYRTNILGKLLTATTEFTVEIEAAFATAENTIFTAFEKGGEVTLTEDIEIARPLVVKSGVEAVLNLNGKTIKNNVDNTDTDVIIVEPGATLTINGEGNVEAVSGNDGYAIIAKGTVIINGGSYKSGYDADNLTNAVVYARGEGKVYINGGEFYSDNTARHTINKRDADRATTIIEIRGGKFQNFNPQDNAAEGTGTNFVAAGYSVVANGEWYEVKKGILVSNNAELKDAVANGATTILLNNSGTDYDLNGIQKDGLTLIGYGEGVAIANNTNFAGGGSVGAIWKAINLKNMTITNTVYTMDNGGNATFEDVTFAQGFRQGYGKGVVFTNCTFGSNSEGFALHFQTDSASEGGQIKLTGCKFNGGKVHLGGKRSYAFSGCEFAAGTDFQIWSNITLENSTVNNTLKVSKNATITVIGNVTVVSTTSSGIAVDEGKELTIVGGANNHLTAKGNGNHAFGIGGNGATVTLDGVTVEYVCGGHIQPLCVNDPNYGKSEPEGGAAIGGAVVNILNSTIKKADGGSKAAAIGAQYWQDAVINIENSTILEANGGNASAGIGGSRYAGDSKYNLEINIKNSNVTATGGQFGAGIGSGYDTHCNQHSYTATNKINIDATSTVKATGGKYAAGIGTGYHSAYLTGAIAAGANVTAVSGDIYYKDAYTTAQNIGYGVVDPAREFSGANTNVTFTVAGEVIAAPTAKAMVDSAEALKAAIDSGKTTILLKSGTGYDLNGIQKDGLTLIGYGEGVEIANTTKYASGKSIGAIWKAINLKNMTITNTVYTMADGSNATFEDVTFEAGFRQGYGKGVVFTNCTFGSNSEGYALHFQTDNASEGGVINLTGCKFNGGKVHLGGKRAYAFSGCEFATGTDFQVWSNISLENCTVDGVAVTASNMATLFPNLDPAKVTLK